MTEAFQNNCAIFERTADGVGVGRCWFYLVDGKCPRHGNVKAVMDHYHKTGKLTDELNLPQRGTK
jgi:hypothetical protein